MSWRLEMPEAPSSNWDGGCPLLLTLLVYVMEDCFPGAAVDTKTTERLSAKEARELALELIRFADAAESVPFEPTKSVRGTRLAPVGGGSR